MILLYFQQINILIATLSHRTWFFIKFERNSPKRQATRTRSFYAILRACKVLFNKNFNRMKENITYILLKDMACAKIRPILPEWKESSSGVIQIPQD